MNSQQWGLTCGKTSCFGARLMQEGNRLHFLADSAGITGNSAKNKPTVSISHSHLFSACSSICLPPQQCVTIYHNWLTCKADTLSTHGYVYTAVYPTPQ